MYLADIRIRNFRCFADETVHFAPGINVLLGENNAGKTTLIKALELVLDQGRRRRPAFFDFHHPCADFHAVPAITITVTFRLYATDAVEDKALVATWLTKLDPPWEAHLTYEFMLESDEEEKCRQALGGVTDQNEYRRVIDSYIDKYVSRIYGGDPNNHLVAERDSLERITVQSLEALRDAGRELFAGSDPLLKRLLRQVRDEGKTAAQKATLDDEFRDLATRLGTHMQGRISLEPLLKLVNDTGAVEGGKPHLADTLGEEDVLAALRLYIEQNGVSLPADQNGLGYNNLIYISLVLASLDHQADPTRRGTNATLFPILCIEEPEAHLHPALQYKLLKHIEKRIKDSKRNRQVFITTHSTHITSATPLDQLVVFTIPQGQMRPHIAYPGKCFLDTPEGRKSKAYVERYLDATKSNLLFSKGVILVEGIAEQLLVPVLAEILECTLEEHHVALIPVGGVTFKHFVPLFGAGLPAAQAQYALRRPLACVIDGDPTRRHHENDAKFRKCNPYELNDTTNYDVKPQSDVVTGLVTLCNANNMIMVQPGGKTLEYDLACENYGQTLLVTNACTHEEGLRALIIDPASTPAEIEETVTRTRQATEHLDEQERARHLVATCYLSCLEGAKGEHAFALAKALKEAKSTASLRGFAVPTYIASSIRWASRQPATEP